MKNPIHIGMAVAATASLGFAAVHGEGGDKNGKEPPASILDNMFQGGGTVVTYKPGSGIAFEGDDYKIVLSGRLQAKWYFLNLENAPDTHSFRLRRARLNVGGWLWSEDTEFKLVSDLTTSPVILDGWVRQKIWGGESGYGGIRFGMGKFHSSRQFDTSSANLEFVQRSVATRTFSTARGTGLVLEGGLWNDAETESDKFHFYVGAVNNDLAAGSALSSRTRTNINNNELNWILGARVDPWGDMGDFGHTEGDLDHDGNFRGSFGANLMLGNDTVGELGGAGATGPDVEVFQVNLNGAVKSGNGIAAQAEVFIRTEDADIPGASDTDQFGWYVQGSYTTAPNSIQWGFGGRLSMVTLQDTGSLLAPVGLESGQGGPLTGAVGGVPVGVEGDLLEATAGVSAYYHKHKLKTQLNYTFQTVDPDATGVADTDNHLLELMFTLSF